MSFFGGLQEFVLAGVDGYVRIESAKNDSVEATPPAPNYAVTNTPGQPGYQPPGLLDALGQNAGPLFVGAGVILAIWLVVKNG